METYTVELAFPAETNIVVGQAHFIKTVEDIYETIVNTAPQMKFGIAFNEASQERLIRTDGNRDDLIQAAADNAERIGAGHVFVIVLAEGFPINILPRLKEVPEVVRIFCATANPLQVVVAESPQGRGVLGVIDGESPLGMEGPEQKQARHEFLRKIGYKR